MNYVLLVQCCHVWLQGILYKKSSKPLSKEWKKKYVTLLEDGRLTYHPSLHVCCLSRYNVGISAQYLCSGYIVASELEQAFVEEGKCGIHAGALKAC